MSKVTVLLLTFMMTGIVACTAESDGVKQPLPEASASPALATATPSPEFEPVAATGTSAATPTPMPPAPSPTRQDAADEQPIVTATVKESPTMTPAAARPTGLESLPQVTQARIDLALRLGVEPDQIAVADVQLVVWSDTSMGCPQPGMAYLQVPQDGLLIRLQAEGQTYDYHSGGTRDPFLCDPKSPTVKETRPLIDLGTLIPPDDPDN